MKTLKEIFFEAADLIDERGRAIDIFYDRTKKCYCMVGAIGHAAGIFGPEQALVYPWNFWEDPIIEEACRTIIGLNAPQFSDEITLFQFNDNNSAADVADLLRKTAEAL